MNELGVVIVLIYILIIIPKVASQFFLKNISPEDSTIYDFCFALYIWVFTIIIMRFFAIVEIWLYSLVFITEIYFFSVVYNLADTENVKTSIRFILIGAIIPLIHLWIAYLFFNRLNNTYNPNQQTFPFLLPFFFGEFIFLAIIEIIEVKKILKYDL
jgi:hypothetical protein